MNKIVLQAQNLAYILEDGTSLFENIDLTVREGDVIGIAGKSGSGKTSLLHIISGLLAPTKGTRTIMRQDLSKLDNPQLSHLREKHLGFIFQTPNLLADFSPIENIALPLIIAGATYQTACESAHSMMEKLAIAHLADRKTGDLSGGEKQRVNIARAIIHKPRIVFADEPTGSLDQDNAENIQQVLFSLQKNTHCALVLVSHDRQFVAQAKRQLILDKGLLTEQ